MKDIVKVLIGLFAIIAVVMVVAALIIKYWERISDFFAEMKMRCPCTHCESDDYADDELNSICPDDMVQ